MKEEYDNSTEFLIDALGRDVDSRESEKIMKQFGYQKSLEDKVKFVDIEKDYDTDHDHAAYTHRIIVSVGETFYECFIDFYGQHEYDDSDPKPVTKVEKKEVVKIIYV